MPKLPTQNRWIQDNLSDKTGNVYYSRNVHFDEQGYVKLSPRTVKIMDENANGDFGVPVALGKKSAGSYHIPTTSDAQFDSSISNTTFAFTENSGSNEPTCTPDSHGAYFNDEWHVSTDTTVVSKGITDGATANWTSRVTGLTSGKRHYLEVFMNKNSLAIGNGNTVQLRDTSYTNTVTLTIPADFEVMHLAYNNAKLGITTRPASSAVNQNAYFFVWDGATASANGGFDMGSESALAVVPYKSSFVVLTRAGELLYFNGGGFDKLASFPFFRTQRRYSDPTQNTIGVGELMFVQGDRIFINTEWIFNPYGRRGELHMQKNPSGVWCFDPKVGLYHRYSMSNSQAYLFAVTDANVNTGTDVMTVSSGTVPQTGSVARYINPTTEIGGLSENSDYYVIKTGATTFKLATTYDNALNSIAIDLTSAGSGGTNYFYMYDIIDYGATYVNTAGAVAPFGDTTIWYQEFLMGGDVLDVDNTSNDVLCMTVPFLENRGYVVTPKIFASGVVDKQQKLVVRFRELATNDAIIVKSKREEVCGLPANSTGGTPGTWSSTTIIYTTDTDFSEAKAYLDASDEHELEMEIISGPGAGQMVQVDSIAQDGNTYSFVLKEAVKGVTGGSKSHFVIDNWRVEDGVTSTESANDDGYIEIPVNSTSKFISYKVELRGYNTTIEDIDIINQSHKPSR